ncbi:hypothetical protein N9Z33_01380 [Akkermansiaceae bacterium]|nr:hypothetical protein [Akkermansiaceae bacterium]
MGEILVRKWQPGDDLSAITALLHRAYAELAEMGFRYTATWQDDEKTLQRLSRGMAFYQKRGFSIVSKADWESTNYESVMMNLAFGDPKLR